MFTSTYHNLIIFNFAVGNYPVCTCNALNSRYSYTQARRERKKSAGTACSYCHSIVWTENTAIGHYGERQSCSLSCQAGELLRLASRAWYSLYVLTTTFTSAHTVHTDYYAERLLQVQVSLRTSSNTCRYLLRVLVLLCNRNTFRLCAVQCYESYYYGNIGNYVQQCVFQSLVTSDNVISVGRVLQLALALIGFLIRFVQHVELWSLRSKLQIIRLWGYGLLICKLKTN